MRWYLASAIGLWFILISFGSALPSSDKCNSSIMDQFIFESTGFSKSVQVKDIIAMLTNCYCEITTDLSDPLAVCLLYSCVPCPSGSQSSSGLCFCSNASLNINSSCLTTHFNKNNQQGSDKKYSCQTFTDLTTPLLSNPSNGCSIRSDAADLVLVLQMKVIGTSGVLEQVFRVICSATSVAPDASNTTVTPVSTTAASSTTVTSTSRNHLSDTTDKIEDQPDNIIASTPTRETIIGIAVGVGGGVPLIIVIVVIIVVLRRRRSESNKLNACALSQTTAVIPSETAYASYTIPVSAAYDNATGTTSNYESIADDNEEVGESSHEYTEVKEISDHNGYDNSETGRSDAYSMCKETDKNYEIVSENPTANTESETTVIDNEFYG